MVEQIKLAVSSWALRECFYYQADQVGDEDLARWGLLVKLIFVVSVFRLMLQLFSETDRCVGGLQLPPVKTWISPGSAFFLTTRHVRMIGPLWTGRKVFGMDVSP